MADQDVINDRVPTSTPTPTAVGDRNGSPAAPDDPAAARLRSEYADRIAAARARFASAVDAMRRAAEAMQEEGRPPSYRLLHALGDCHRDFLRLRHEITVRAQALSVPLPPLDTLAAIGDLARHFGPPPGIEIEPAPPAVAPTEPEAPERPTEPPPSPVEAHGEAAPVVTVVVPPTPAATDQVEQSETVETVPVEPEPEPPVVAPPEATAPEIETPAPEPVADVPEATAPERVEVEEAEHPGEAVRRSALEVIDTVLRLVVRDGSDFPPLNDCRASALALREKVAGAPPSDLPAEAAELAGGEHPLAGLLTVVSGTGGLSDADWAAVHARVTETFGRPLAVAAARGRLKVAPPQ